MNCMVMNNSLWTTDSQSLSDFEIFLEGGGGVGALIGLITEFIVQED